MKSTSKWAVVGVMLLAASRALAQEEDSAFLTVPDPTVAGVTSGVTNPSVLPRTPITIDVLTELKADTTVVTASSPGVGGAQPQFPCARGVLFRHPIGQLPAVQLGGDLERDQLVRERRGSLLDVKVGLGQSVHRSSGCGITTEPLFHY